MNNVKLLKKHQPLQDLNRDSPDQVQAQTFEIIES